MNVTEYTKKLRKIVEALDGLCADAKHVSGLNDDQIADAKCLLNDVAVGVDDLAARIEDIYPDK